MFHNCISRPESPKTSNLIINYKSQIRKMLTSVFTTTYAAKIFIALVKASDLSIIFHYEHTEKN